MNDNDIMKYLPIATSAIAILCCVKNGNRISSLESKCNKNFGSVANALNGFEEFKGTAFENFRVLQKDINKISHFVGFKGRLGVNE